jgi:hypothetical protein
VNLDSTYFFNSEVVHYYNSRTGESITQFGNDFRFNIAGRVGNIKIPLHYKLRVFLYSRLGRRLSRLDKGTCVYIPEFSRLIIVYQYSIYTYDLISNVLDKVSSLQFRNPLFCGTLVLNGNEVYFGEYFNNFEGREVNLYRSSDGGDNWDIIYTFEKESIHHIHGVYHDPFTDEIWVCTGDYDGQCRILRADKDFKNVEILGDGSQAWRAVSMFFLEDRVVWGMDSPLDDVYVMSYDRSTGKLHRGQPLSGPVWYSKHTSDGYGLIQTSVEYMHMRGVKDIEAHIYVSSDFDTWTKVSSWKKDIYPHRYFRHGVIMFSDGDQALNKFAIHGEGVIGLDGRSALASIDENEVY